MTKSKLPSFVFVSWLAYLYLFSKFNYYVSSEISFPVLNSLPCDLIMKKHANINGVGIFAGRDYKKGEIVERCISVSIPINSATKLLSEYVFAHDNEHVDLVLGYGMIYNHHHNSSLLVIANTARSPRISDNDNNYNNLLLDYSLQASYDIKKGEELFTNYGDESWFSHNNITYIDERNKTSSSCTFSVNPTGEINGNVGDDKCPPKHLDNGNHDVEDVTMTTVHGCPMSLTQIVNGRVYATQYIALGSIVEVARALLIPAFVGNGNDLDRYLWYSYRHRDIPDSSYAILLLGLGSLYRSSVLIPPPPPLQPNQGQELEQEEEGEDIYGNNIEDSNLHYSWYFLEDVEGNEGSEGNNDADGQNKSVSGSLGKKCSEKMFVSFRARKDIQPNEELTVPLLLRQGTNRRYILDHWFDESLSEWCL